MDRNFILVSNSMVIVIHDGNLYILRVKTKKKEKFISSQP